MVAERFETERLANRIMRRELVRTCLECFGSCFVGLVIMAVGFHAMSESSRRLPGPTAAARSAETGSAAPAAA